MKRTTIHRDCLVAVVSSDADLARFTDELWYRIPARALGRAISADALDELRHIALYQTGTITAGLPGTVEVHGAIASITVEPRRAVIPSEPAHPAADEPYHVIRIAALERLERPLVSHRPRRITFVRTTRERLIGARDINELFVGSPAEEALWSSLRELGAERRCFMHVSDEVMEVDFAIVRGPRTVGVLCGDDEPYGPIAAAGEWSIVRFSAADVERDLEACLREIMRMLEGGGGAADRMQSASAR
ncbi:MAG TPA: hypothetical protein VNA88_00155 [Candidatus Kapabacteria bacterium]|nr:hypothetical protein [Candidatus Kapabacteria bacterium]